MGKQLDRTRVLLDPPFAQFGPIANYCRSDPRNRHIADGLVDVVEKSCGRLAVVARLLRDLGFVVFFNKIADCHRNAGLDVPFEPLVVSLFQRVLAFIEQPVLRLRHVAHVSQRSGCGTTQPHVPWATILGRLVLEYPRSPLASVANLQIEISAIGVQAVLGGLYEPCRQFMYRHQSLCARAAYIRLYLSLGGAFRCTSWHNGAPMSTRKALFHWVCCTLVHGRDFS